MSSQEALPDLLSKHRIPFYDDLYLMRSHHYDLYASRTGRYVLKVGTEDKADSLRESLRLTSPAFLPSLSDVVTISQGYASALFPLASRPACGLQDYAGMGKALRSLQELPVPEERVDLGREMREVCTSLRAQGVVDERLNGIEHLESELSAYYEKIEGQDVVHGDARMDNVVLWQGKRVFVGTPHLKQGPRELDVIPTFFQDCKQGITGEAAPHVIVGNAMGLGSIEKWEWAETARLVAQGTAYARSLASEYASRRA